MKAFLASVVLAGVLAGSAQGAIIKLRWQGMGGSPRLELAPGESGVAEIYIRLGPEETLGALRFRNLFLPDVTQIETDVGPAGWSDFSSNGTLGAPSQLVAFLSPLPQFALEGPGTYLVGTQTLQLNYDDQQQVAIDMTSLVLRNAHMQHFPAVTVRSGSPELPLLIVPAPATGAVLGALLLGRGRRRRDAA